MRIRPVYIWLPGVFFFGLSIIIWGRLLGGFVRNGQFDWTLDRHSVAYLYLPLLAAGVGLVTPLVCLWRLWAASWRSNARLFTIYAAIMLTWGAIDVRLERYQLGGHHHEGNPLIEGHSS